MTGLHAVDVEVGPPPSLQRYQVAVRLAIAIVLAIVGVTARSIVGALYVVLPVLAAVAIGTRRRWLEDDGLRLWRILRWLLGLAAYEAFLIESLPDEDSHALTVELRTVGVPRPLAALARLITSIPSGLVLLGLLWPIGAVLWVVTAIYVVAGARIPTWIRGVQLGILRWNARLVAYHASLVDEYPPFHLDTDLHADIGDAGTYIAAVTPSRAAESRQTRSMHRSS